MSDYAEQLSSIHLFKGLKPAGLRRVAAVTEEETHAEGTHIFRHGESGDRLYLVLEGKVRISRSVSGVGEEALAVLGAGHAFGELALLDEATRSADAIAQEQTKVLTISKERFDDLLFADKELAYEILWGTVRLLAGRLRETNDKLTFLSATSQF